MRENSRFLFFTKRWMCVCAVKIHQFHGNGNVFWLKKKCSKGKILIAEDWVHWSNQTFLK